MRTMQYVVTATAIFGALLIANPAFAQTSQERLAEAKADLDRARRDLRNLANQRQALIDDLSVDEKEWVGGAILDMYRTAKKFNHLREQRDRGDITEEEAIEEFEKFTRIRTGESSLEGSIYTAMPKVKKGRLGKFDELDQKQENVMQRFRDAQQRVRKLERRRWPDEIAKAARRSGGSLAIMATPTSAQLKVGEAATVTLVVSGSKPPFRLRIASLSGDDQRSIALDDQQPQEIPFSFSTPGTRTVYITVEDESQPQHASVNLTFHVLDDEPEEEKVDTVDADDEEEHSPEKKPTEPKEPQIQKEPKKRTTPGHTAKKLAAGTYRANLWPGVSMYTRFQKDLAKKSPPMPVTITFDGGGGVTGTGEWKLTRADTDPDLLARWNSLHSETTFKIEGSVNWSTGEMRLRLVDGKTSHMWVSDRVRLGDDEQYEYDLAGWQMGDPRFEPILAQSRQMDPDDMAGHAPFLRRNPDGSCGWAGDGWAGIVSRDGTSIGSSRYTLKKLVSWVETDGKRTEEDNTTEFADSKSHPHSWYLMILNRTTTLPPQQPALPQPAEGNLVGFGIWPESPFVVRAGDTVQLDAVGVYLENVYDVQNLNNRNTQWANSRGLTQLGPGRYQLPKDSTKSAYYVRVRKKRNDGTWMSDTVKIVVAP
ncbi:MAG: hypothetical protein ISR77_18340 [Pirellulaceae bacterium]|nr:hypothetical protein [Pirellulaceae bacterium]